MTNLETNTRARRVEPVVLEWWGVVTPNGELIPDCVHACKADAAAFIGYPLGNYQVRKVKLTIEVVE